MLDLNKIYLLDCMEGMAQFPDKYFDLAIVDPPYGSSIMKKNKYQRHGTKDTTYRNKDIPGADYFMELKRVSKESIIWGSQYMMKYLDPSGSYIIWDKGADPDKHNMSACDVAWYSKRKQIKKIYLHWCGAVKCEMEDTIHIHQKPVQLYKWILHNYAKPDMKIIDTHAGSCSSVISFLDFGCEWIGFEIDADYHKAASERIEIHKAQLKLF